MIEVLKDILISAGEIDRYYEKSPINLWRAKKIKDKGTLFGLVENDKVLSNGQIRPADITITVKTELNGCHADLLREVSALLISLTYLPGTPGNITKYLKEPYFRAVSL